MTALSDLLNQRLPDGWSADQVVAAAERAGHSINRATVYDYLGGRHAKVPSEAVLQAFAAALPGTTIEQLRGAADVPTGEREPYVPPPEAHRLNRRQREAINELIRAIAAEQRDAGQQVAGPAKRGPRRPATQAALEARQDIDLPPPD